MRPAPRRRTHGRAPRGTRLVAAVPRSHGPNLTCLAALTATGIGPAIVFDGALDGAIFTQWVTEALVPSLRPGQVVILDNLRVHKVVAARDAIAAAGGELRFLPAYAPDFNPIEQIFSRLKAHLRAVGARAIPAAAIGVALDTVTADQTRTTFRHAGYHDTW
ncbi:MAG: transposase [Thermomicrobiales bacterium]